MDVQIRVDRSTNASAEAYLTVEINGRDASTGQPTAESHSAAVTLAKQDGEWVITGAREIGGIYPPNVLPREIDTDHPERIRAVVVESGNPLVTGADTRAYRAAFEKLELLVVIDVALTETARLADYVLPAATQFEKYEATFFKFGIGQGAIARTASRTV